MPFQYNSIPDYSLCDDLFYFDVYPMARASSVKGFTLREILMIIIVISVGLLSVVFALSRGMNYVQHTRQKMLALDLAREGIEAVYNIRDTNWKRWAGVKDACRLKIDPLLDEGKLGCADDTWMMSGYYLLDQPLLSGQYYFALTGISLSGNSGEDMYDYLTSSAALCAYSGSWQPCSDTGTNSSQGKFFRLIEGKGLYFKDDLDLTGGRYMECTSGLLSTCANIQPKEFRFCSRVWYGGLTTGQVQICSLITNFQE